MCADDSGPLGQRKAIIRACRIVSLLRQRCPEFSIKDFIEFLEWPRLKSYFVGQDAVMVRPNPKAGDEWRVHPKIHILPLGWGGAMSPQGPGGSKYVYQMETLQIEGHWTLRLFNSYFERQKRPNLLMAIFSSRAHRQVLLGQILQRVRIPKDLSSSMHGPLYRKALLSARVALSPPGWGSDCYRHYETLAHGVALLVPVTSVSLSALRSLPVIVADDMALVTEDKLERSLAKLTAEAQRRRKLGEPKKSMMYALTKRYLIESIQHVARSDHNGSSWPLPELSVRLRRRPEDDLSTGVFTPGHVGWAIRNDTQRYQERNPSAWENGGPYFGKFGTGNGVDYCECPCQCGLCDDEAAKGGFKSSALMDEEVDRKARISKRQSERWAFSDCSCEPTFDHEDDPEKSDERVCSGGARRRI